MFKYYLYRFSQMVMHRLSWPTSYKIAVFISDLHYFFSFRDRRAVKSNLKTIVPQLKEPKLSQITREVFRNFGRYLNEFFQMAKKVDQKYLQEKIKVENLDRLQKVISHGKGGIVLTAHLGNWELGGILVAMLGFPITAIALSHKDRPVNDLFNHQRLAKGMGVVPTNYAIRRCTELLKSNKFVAIAADRDFSLNGEVMDFLGRKTAMPKGAAMFSLRTGAPIIPTFLVRGENNTFTLSFEEPIFPPPRNRDEQEEHRDMVDLMRKYIQIIEKRIREHPEQWLMFREFWKEDANLIASRKPSPPNFSPEPEELNTG